jgi:hypothetical protein
MKSMRTLAAGGLFFGLAVFVWAQGSDNFTGTTPNTTNWPVSGIFSSAGATLTQNGQLQFTSPGGDSYTGWSWSGQPTYATSWWAQVEVNVPDFSLSASNQQYSAGLYIEGGPGSYGNGYSVSATLAPFYSASFSREFDSELLTNGSSTSHVHPETAATNAILRVEYDSNSHTISTFYDTGSGLVSLLATDISATGANWGMGSNDVFNIAIVGTSTNFVITAGDSMYLDNFSTNVSAVPEPSTYAAIFGSVALAGVMLHRRRRLA